MNTLPLALVELIQEYNGGIRVKSGHLQIRIGDKKEYGAKVNPGIWFVRNMPYIYKDGVTLIITLVKRYGVKVGKIPMEIKEEGVSSNILSICSDEGVEFNNFGCSFGVIYYQPIIEPDYIVIPRTRRGLMEVDAEDFTLNYCAALTRDTSFRLLQSVLPDCKVTSLEEEGRYTFNVQLHEMKTRDRALIFPRLRKYPGARWLQVGAGSIILDRGDKTLITLQLNDLCGGSGAEAVSMLFDKVEEHPQYMDIYRRLMKRMESKLDKGIKNIKYAEGKAWITYGCMIDSEWIEL